MALASSLAPAPLAPALTPHLDPRRWLGLLALSISVLTVIMTSTSVNLALPAISASFGISVSNLTWVLDAYTLALGALTLPGGTLGDIFGRRRMYMIGLGIFTTGALCSSVAPNLGLLVAARILMGIGASLVLPGTLSLISAMFVGRERATAIGLWGGMNGLALAIGPVVGGVLVEYVGWRAVFWTNVPLVAVALLMVPRFVPAVAPKEGKHHFDIPGVLSSAGALTALIGGLIEGPSWGWASLATLSCFAAAVLLLVAFVLIESHSAHPMVPLALFESRTFCAANISAVVMMLSVLSCFFFLSLFLQDVLDWSAVRSGIAYLPLALFLVVLAPFAGRLSSRLGPRTPLLIGLTLSAVGVIWMSQVNGHSGYSSLIGGLLLVGAGLGLASPAVSNAAVSSVPPSMAGVASGMNAMARQVGGAVGVALLTAIFSGRFSDHLARALHGSALSAAQQAQVLSAASSGVSVVPSGNSALSATSGAHIQQLTHTAFALGMSDTLHLFSVIALIGVLAATFIRRSDFVAARQFTAPYPSPQAVPMAQVGTASR